MILRTEQDINSIFIIDKEYLVKDNCVNFDDEHVALALSNSFYFAEEDSKTEIKKEEVKEVKQVSKKK